MKVILTGSTGFIGGEVLLQALAHPAITSVVALTRRELSGEELVKATGGTPGGGGEKKLEVVLIKDFMNYGDEVLRKCEGAGGVIWYVLSSLLNSSVWFFGWICLQKYGVRNRTMRYSIHVSSF